MLCRSFTIFYFYNIYYQNERGVCFYRFTAELEQQSGWELRTIFFQTSLKYDLSFKYFDPLIRQLKTKTTPNAFNPANLDRQYWSFLQSFPFVHEKVHLLMNTCPSVKNHAENCTMSKQLNQWWISVSVGVIHKVCVYVCVHVRVCVCHVCRNTWCWRVSHCWVGSCLNSIFKEMSETGTSICACVCVCVF